MESRKNLSILCYDLGGKLAVRILQLLERRDVRESPYQAYHHDDQRDGNTEKYPERLHYPFSCLVCHISFIYMSVKKFYL